MCYIKALQFFFNCDTTLRKSKLQQCTCDSTALREPLVFFHIPFNLYLFFVLCWHSFCIIYQQELANDSPPGQVPVVFINKAAGTQPCWWFTRCPGRVDTTTADLSSCDDLWQTPYGWDTPRSFPEKVCRPLVQNGWGLPDFCLGGNRHMFSLWMAQNTPRNDATNFSPSFPLCCTVILRLGFWFVLFSFLPPFVNLLFIYTYVTLAVYLRCLTASQQTLPFSQISNRRFILLLLPQL